MINLIRTKPRHKVKELVTNIQDVADYYDPRLINSSGITVSDDRTLWVANNDNEIRKRCITHYDLYGVKLSEPIPLLVYQITDPLVPPSEQRRLISDLLWLQKSVLYYRVGTIMSIPKINNFPPILGTKGNQPSPAQTSLSVFLSGEPPNYANGYLGRGVNIYFLINYCIWNPFPLKTTAGKKATAILNNAHFRIYNNLLLDLFNLELIEQYGQALLEAQRWLLLTSSVPEPRSTSLSFSFSKEELASFKSEITTYNQIMPIGVCYNQSRGFVGYEFNDARVSCDIIVVTSEGIIYVYSPLIHTGLYYGAIAVLDNSNNYSVYTGITMINDRIFIADFANQRIDVYTYGWDTDSDLESKFVDPDLPSDYGPFNVMARNNKIYVLYAKHDHSGGLVNNRFAVGPGLGIINVFSINGDLIQRAVTGGQLNAPWGITVVKNEFSEGRYLIANHGDGRILIYDSYWKYLGALNYKNYPNSITNLYGIVSVQDSVFFTSGPNGIVDGLLGKIKPIYYPHCHPCSCRCTRCRQLSTSCSPCSPCSPLLPLPPPPPPQRLPCPSSQLPIKSTVPNQQIETVKSKNNDELIIQPSKPRPLQKQRK
ncbi:MAG: TIGR03118 family protein [candidate division WOR-3 bacterium]